jgi:hypothetical protein
MSRVQIRSDQFGLHGAMRRVSRGRCFDIDISICEDADLWARIAQITGFVFVDLLGVVSNLSSFVDAQSRRE